MSDTDNTPDDVQMVRQYHEATKHHYHRSAPGPGFMDWATQPDPFRRFLGAELVHLPLQAQGGTPGYEDIFLPGKVGPYALNAASIGRFLECSLALSAWKELGESRWPLRVNPSSGNLHPTEGYLLLPEIDGISPLPGVYHYAPKEHALERRADFSGKSWGYLPENVFLVALSSICWREAWKYGERAFRYCQLDCGHAYMALDVAARVLGWRIDLLQAVADQDIAGLTGLNRSGEFREDEPEWPELLAVVNCQPGRAGILPGLPREFIDGVIAGTWYGEANQLSPAHREWPLIGLVHQATVKPRTGQGLVIPEMVCSSACGYEPGLSAGQVIRRRRSAVDMDGSTGITREKFVQILQRVSGPIRGVPWYPAVHLCLFVHRVEGIPSGLYMLIRDAGSRDAVRQAMHHDFEWAQPRECPSPLMLYRLRAGDFTDVSRHISCGQDIAGDGAFSLGMIARFDDTLSGNGGWSYRRLFWEAGMIGQLLYLEAEAIGMSATGIGCFFDDPVHELLGLKGSAFQSLYHLTIGKAVIDHRLTTLPAYGRPGRMQGDP